ncbi:N-acetylmuramoyl-L-alanine amidase [Varunaivibrio sulfuroxidans]|nr:N-acetylmuramoyl-L-alanine amidase [Varunaivibrio sulfuroxidans]WES30581.1 N-acetylmuramoyl-L-alanine amidase [Varunaivibrio sulfuroxidans]
MGSASEAAAQQPAAAHPTTVVSNIRVGAHPGETRVVIDLNTEITYDAFVLPQPYRVVLDLPEVGWRLPAKPLPSGVGQLDKLRYGLFSPGVTRVVLDMKGPVRIKKTFLLKPKNGHAYRLVMDLQGVSPAVFRTVLSEQRKARRAKGTPRPVAAPAATGASAEVAASGGTVPRTTEKISGAGLIAGPVPVPKSTQKPRTPRKMVIAIDAGHGGVDPGTIGADGQFEKNITLKMARELRDVLRKTGRYKVVLTRNKDIFLRLRQRVAVARAAGADLFISIHADSTRNRKVRGLSVYTLSERASDKEAASLAEKENKADLIAGIDLTGESPDVTNILIDLAQRESMNQSAQFATQLVKELRKSTKLLRKTHRFAGFAVLKAPDMPSVLIELGFLSNPQDEKALQSRRYRAMLAHAILRGIDTHFKGVEEARRN